MLIGLKICSKVQQILQVPTSENQILFVLICWSVGLGFFYCQCVYTFILVRYIIEMWKLPVILVISKLMSDSTYQTFCIIYTYVNCILVSVNLFLSKVIRKFARNRYTES